MPRKTKNANLAFDRLAAHLDDDVQLDGKWMTVQGHRFYGKKKKLLAHLVELALQDTRYNGYGMMPDEVREVIALTHAPARGLSGWERAAVKSVLTD